MESRIHPARDFNFRICVPMIITHGICLLAFYTGVSWTAIGVFLCTYLVRMFGITAGFHRYFSHRSFKTNRFFQFFLAFIGTASGQNGPLWWAAHHRDHHRFSDQEGDLHSPVRSGFWWAHLGWIFANSSKETKLHNIRDFANYPEIVWLNRYYVIPPFLLALALFVFGELLAVYFSDLKTNGLQLVIWGFFISTVVLYHMTFSVNSLAHLWGSRRFETTDDSRNNFLIALVTLGEGWHNNHHRFPYSERQGIKWWEVDMAHYVLVVFESLGWVSELKEPKERALRKEKCDEANQLAA